MFDVMILLVSDIDQILVVVDDDPLELQSDKDSKHRVVFQFG